jgi:hypothetical protein
MENGIVAWMSRHRAAKVDRIGANPGARAAVDERALSRGMLGSGSGLGPWVGARGAPQQCPILRPGHHRL